MSANNGDQDLVSYVTLRRVVGVLGVTLPIILALWGFFLCHCLEIQPSVSDYYRLRTRDALVGVLFTIAWFLFTYKGYERKDDIAGNLACVFALCVALFPNSGTTLEKRVHFGSACAFFLVLSYFSLFLFTKSQGVPTREKRIRNVIYRVCGVSILLCIALIGLYYGALKGTALDALEPVFWLESFALWAFGTSWFIKGDTLFRDAALYR
jgi:dolichyl-phosphate-mannose--protein O-mannosyl transferase